MLSSVFICLLGWLSKGGCVCVFVCMRERMCLCGVYACVCVSVCEYIYERVCLCGVCVCECISVGGGGSVFLCVCVC